MTKQTYDAHSMKEELDAAAERGAARREKMQLKPARDDYGVPLPDTSLHAMLDERGSRYGKFTDHAETTQEIKAAIYKRLKGKTIKADQIEALEMIAHKIGRIVCGDPDYEDSWRDIAGYATLVADRLMAREER